MNKTELVAAVAAKAEISKAAAAKAVEATLASINEGLKADGNVQLIGFGTLKVVEKKAHMGVNPATGKKIEIAAKKAVKFVASKNLAK